MDTAVIDNSAQTNEQFTDHEPIIPVMKNSKRERKEACPFGRAFFPAGTICEVQVTKHMHPTPIVVTVDKLVRNGPDSYVITTGKMNEATGMEEAYNIAHVKRILKRGEGVAQIDKGDDRYANYLEVEGQHGHSSVRKHHSQYRTGSPIDLALAVAGRYLFEDDCVDPNKLNELLQKEHLFHTATSGRYFQYTVYLVNKKKFRKAVKRLLPKCLMKHREAQKQYDKFWVE